jgi:hypothetical protein
MSLATTTKLRKFTAAQAAQQASTAETMTTNVHVHCRTGSSAKLHLVGRVVENYFHVCGPPAEATDQLSPAQTPPGPALEFGLRRLAVFRVVRRAVPAQTRRRVDAERLPFNARHPFHLLRDPREDRAVQTDV